MADKKISQLTSATTPLSGSEVLPVVQSGATVQVSVNNLTAGKAVNASNIYTTGDSGFGTAAPWKRLTVVGDIAVSRNAAGVAGDAAINFGSNTNNYIYAGNGANIMAFAVNGAERARITSSGNFGLGTPGPSYQLQLSTDSAAKPSTNTWTIASDARIKTETGEYTKGLDAVCALRPVTYTYNGAAGFEADGKENISIIAQEAKEHFPECVGTFEAILNKTDKTPTELYNWNGHALTFALVNAVRELKNLNASLEARVAALEAA